MKNLIIIAAILLAGCATEFKAYEGRDIERMGQGGTKVTIKGVDIWENGDPPRRYKILGILEDQRPGGPIGAGTLNEAIADKTKEVGGDAAIMMNSNDQVAGFVSTYNFAGGFGTGVSAPSRRLYSKFTVVKYTD